MAKNKNTVVELVETTTEIEAPYELPEGWKWCRLPDYVSIVTGKKDANYGSPDGKYYFFTCAEIPLRCDGFSFSGESLLLPGNGANVGQVIYYDGDFEVYQRTYVLQKISNNISLKYLYYHILAFWEVYNRDKQYGSATNYIKMGNFLNYTFPLPPTLEEQQRIVNRIETLFAKLDQAKEKAQNVVDTFETRKSSILHKAFNNQLKIYNGELKDEDWVKTTIGETVKLLSGQDFKPEDYNDSENGIPYITGASNFDNNHVIINRWTEKPTVIARKNDVLLVCKGSGYGKTIIADFEEAHIARQIMSLQPDDKVNNKFIQYFLQNNYEYLRNGGQGLIPGISRSVVLEMPIKLPPINYQLSIVNFLDVILEKETKAKEAALTVLEQIDLLKKSILARAFRGEL